MDQCTSKWWFERRTMLLLFQSVSSLHGKIRRSDSTASFHGCCPRIVVIFFWSYVNMSKNPSSLIFDWQFQSHAIIPFDRTLFALSYLQSSMCEKIFHAVSFQFLSSFIDQIIRTSLRLCLWSVVIHVNKRVPPLIIASRSYSKSISSSFLHCWFSFWNWNPMNFFMIIHRMW